MDVINRNNYEAYFLLYADNELSPAERQAVEAFIIQHPDLATEFEALQNTRFQPEEITFNAKNLLYRFDTSALNITIDNCEEYFILYYDNELDANAKKAVEAFVAANPLVKENFELFGQLNIAGEEEIAFPAMASLYRLPSGDSYTKLLEHLDNELPANEAKKFEKELQQNAGLNKEYQLFAQTKLVADASVKFPNIESLYRKEDRRAPVIPIWMRFAAAAAVLLFVAWMAFWRNNGTQPSTEPVAKQVPVNTVPANKNNNAVQQSANTNDINTVADNTNTQPVNNALNDNTNSNTRVTSLQPDRNNNTQAKQMVPGPDQKPSLVQEEKAPALPEELKKIIDRPQANENVASVQQDAGGIKPENITGTNKANEAVYASYTEKENASATMTVMNIPADNIVKTSGLKSVGRKISRFFERKIKNGNPLSIAGVEVALAR